MAMARSVICPSGGATPRLGRRQAIALAGGGMAALGFGKPGSGRSTRGSPAERLSQGLADRHARDPLQPDRRHLEGRQRGRPPGQGRVHHRLQLPADQQRRLGGRGAGPQPDPDQRRRQGHLGAGRSPRRPARGPRPGGQLHHPSRGHDRHQLLERGDHPWPGAGRQPERGADQDPGRGRGPGSGSRCAGSPSTRGALP